MMRKIMGNITVLFMAICLVFVFSPLCEASSDATIQKYLCQGVWQRIRCSTPEYPDAEGKNYGATHGSPRNVPERIEDIKKYMSDIKILSEYMDTLNFEFTYIPDGSRVTGNCSRNPHGDTWLLELEFSVENGKAHEIDTYTLVERKK